MKPITAIPAALVAAVATVALAAPAQAASPAGQPFELQCDDGRTYLAWANGEGDWTPAHVVGSTGRLLPVAFRGLSATAYDPDGGVVFSEQVPDDVLPGRHTADLTCAFAITGDLGDGFSFVYAGTVDLRATPRG